MNGGPILPNKIDYENMSKEELLQVMKNRNKQYKWQKACVLSPKEGEKLESEIFSISGAEPYRDGKAAARVQSGYEDSHADRAHWISG